MRVSSLGLGAAVAARPVDRVHAFCEIGDDAFGVAADDVEPAADRFEIAAERFERAAEPPAARPAERAGRGFLVVDENEKRRLVWRRRAPPADRRA